MAILASADIPDELYECTDQSAEPGSRMDVLRNAQAFIAKGGLSCWAVATDGRVAAIVRVAADSRFHGRHLVAKEDANNASGFCRLVDDMKNAPPPDRRQYPCVEQMMPNDWESRKFSVRIDARKLLAAQRALRDKGMLSEGIDLFVAGPDDPVILRGDRGFGLLMPMARDHGDPGVEMRSAVRQLMGDYKASVEPVAVVGEMIS